MITWQCTRCAVILDGNPRFCTNCGYTVYRPLHLAEKNAQTVQSSDQLSDGES